MKKVFAYLMIAVLAIMLVGCGDKVHTVEFYVNDQVIDTQEVKHGEKAKTPAVPEVEGYDFVKWDQDFSAVKSDLKVNAIFEIKKFTVTFYDCDDNVIKEETVEYDKKATAPEAPIREGHIFKGWSEEFEHVTSNLDIYPEYDEQVFSVKFYDGDNELIKDVKVRYGKDAHSPSVPNRKGYTFKEWDIDFKNVTKDLEVHAIYGIADYEINYYEGTTKLEGLEPSSYNINSGASISLPDAPKKDGYEFLGWFEGNKRVVTFFSSDAETKSFYAKYRELPKPLVIPDDCKFMFKNIKKIPHSTVPNLFVYQPDFTGLDVPKGSTQYKWSCLQENVAKISQWSSISVVSPGYAIIRAENLNDKTLVGYAVIKVNADGVFISSIEEATHIKKFTVEFHDENGKVISTQEVEESKAATLPTPPIKEGYTFVGWSAEHFNIKENLTLEPTYKKGVSDYVGKTVSILGDSITTFTGYIPDGYASFFPYPTADVADVNQTWWMQVINNLGMKLLKNNSYAGSCVSSGTGSSSATNDERLAELLDGDIKPDIILIYMGANDCASSNVSLTMFDSSYKIVIDKIQKMCPDSQIYLINLPYSKMYNDTDRDKYNEVIKKYADSYKLPLLDITTAFQKDTVGDYLVDSAHPNKKGMKLMSDKIIMDLLKLKGIE